MAFLPKAPAGPLLVLLFLSACAGRQPISEPQCPDVAEDGHLNVLTINLLATEIDRRDVRLSRIAEFAADNRVDVLLLQEVVGGALAKTENSARDLKDVLADDHGLSYDLRVAFEFGVPGVFFSANGVLSRCKILFRRVERLPAAPEDELGDIAIELERNVLMTRLDVPGFDGVSIYNTHLCARCAPAERLEQLTPLLEFVDRVEGDIPGSGPIVLGGDFNIDIFRDNEAERPLYDRIIGSGHRDAYEQSRALADLCEEPRMADEHCTVGVSEIDGSNARRIDYLFIKAFGEVRNSRVVFNTLVGADQPTVSDHAGVFVSVELP